MVNASLSYLRFPSFKDAKSAEAKLQAFRKELQRLFRADHKKVLSRFDRELNRDNLPVDQLDLSRNNLFAVTRMVLEEMESETAAMVEEEITVQSEPVSIPLDRLYGRNKG